MFILTGGPSQNIWTSWGNMSDSNRSSSLWSYVVVDRKLKCDTLCFFFSQMPIWLTKFFTPVHLSPLVMPTLEKSPSEMVTVSGPGLIPGFPESRKKVLGGKGHNFVTVSVHFLYGVILFLFSWQSSVDYCLEMFSGHLCAQMYKPLNKWHFYAKY